MLDGKRRLDPRLRLLCLLTLWCAVGLGASPIAPAWGQEGSPVPGTAAAPSTPAAEPQPAAPQPATPPPAAPPTPAPGPAQVEPKSATARLVRQLVQRGLIDAAEAEALVAQAEAEARALEGPSTPQGVKRVNHVPEVVKAELRAEIKAEVLEEAKRENWAAPNAFPEWTKRVKLYGDVRTRYEVDILAGGNAVDYYPDFNAINTGKPFDALFRDQANERWLNTNRRRSRARVRARIGADADLGEGFSTVLRLASGDGSSPVSTNQTLGGSGGNFSKYQFWIDRVAIQYQPWNSEAGRLGLMIGRFEKPFFSTDLIWSENVNFDGVAIQGGLRLGPGLRSFFAAGAFPLFNTAFDLAIDRPYKFKSRDKWLYAAQVGTDWKPADRFGFKLGAAFYWFDKVEASISDACDTYLKDVSCDTDHSRPSYAQKGNTYRALRTPSLAALDAELTGGASRYQYFGLASRFRELVATARLEVLPLPDLMLAVEGEFVRNQAFRRSYVGPDAVNNFKACRANDTSCQANPDYGGGNNGYLARISLGTPGLSHRWDWNVAVSYRNLQSDATVDAFTDSDFALGGTNCKGFDARAALALASNVAFGARWFSSDVIVGPQYSIDGLLIDLSARY